jgi:glutamate-5-semialdehyde dehydrogenase
MDGRMNQMGVEAKAAARKLGNASTEKKNSVLNDLADRLITEMDEILAANEADLESARRSGLSAAMQDRLMLNPERIKGMASDLHSVVSLPDPVGKKFDDVTLPNGLKVCKMRVPIGVLGVIYEARPNVTVDVTGLAIKSGNAILLRGGSETMNSNRALVNVIRRSIAACQLPREAIQFVDDPDRARVLELLQMDRYVDMIIPRGGAALHEFCREHSRIPVITGGIGICHIFVDESADLKAANDVIYNAKVQRPSVCNALDTVLVHSKVAEQFLPMMVLYLSKAGLSFRVEPVAWKILESADLPVEIRKSIQPAREDDFDTEWLSLVLGIKVVDGLHEAITHIADHSTGHSDGILTNVSQNGERFVAEVDSAVVYINSSTRFTDGGQLGLGAEVAISTQRLHARGPMALAELTTYKWVVVGNYHIRK